MPTLLMLSATGETRQIHLNPRDNKVGRGPTNDVIIDSAEASRDHALIDVDHAFVTITDLGSRNGTFVNDVQIESQVLADGDVIRLGSYAMRFVATDQEFTQIEALRLLTMHGLLIDLPTPAGNEGEVTKPGTVTNARRGA